MPFFASCKFALAMNDNSSRTSSSKRKQNPYQSALHRLQQRRKPADSLTDVIIENLASSPSMSQLPLPASPISLITSPIIDSQDHQQAWKRFNPHRRRKSNLAISSADLPLASSDLYVDDDLALAPVLLLREQDNITDEEMNTVDDKWSHNRRRKGSLSQELSPSKVAKRLSTFVSSLDFDFDSLPSSPTSICPPSPRNNPPRKAAAAARKQVIDVTIINDHLDLQHNNHIGMQKDEDAEQMQMQLSQIAIALNFDDDGDGRIPVKDLVPSQDSCSSEASLASSFSEGNSPTASECKALPISSPADVEVTSRASSTAGSSPGLTRLPTKRKPVPKPRQLTELYDLMREEVSQEEEEMSVYAPLIHTQDVSPESIDVPMLSSQDHGTIKNQISPPAIQSKSSKRLVPGPGPAGDLITDTANGRWNCALDEIKRALKAEGDGDVGGQQLNTEDDLQRIDAILARCNIVS